MFNSLFVFTVPMVIVNVYARNGKIDKTTWDSLLDQDEKHIAFFCGDFNARGRQWGNDITNKQWEVLEDALVASDVVCLNDGTVTRTASRSGETDSSIDLVGFHGLGLSMQVKCVRASRQRSLPVHHHPDQEAQPWKAYHRAANFPV